MYCTRMRLEDHWVLFSRLIPRDKKMPDHQKMAGYLALHIRSDAILYRAGSFAAGRVIRFQKIRQDSASVRCCKGSMLVGLPRKDRIALDHKRHRR